MMIDGKELKLSVRRIDSLHPHEETSDDVVKSLRQRMTEEWMQKDPIVIDEKNGIILDGMHRFAALGGLGARHAVCFEENYDDDEIRVFRWLRYLRKPRPVTLKKLRKSLGLSQATSAEEAMESVDSGDSSVALIARDEGFVSSGSINTEGYGLVRVFDKISLRSGEEVEILEEDVAIDLVRSSGALLLTDKIRKEDVVRAGESGRLLPFKTTLHVLPIRVLGIDFPISDLSVRRSAEATLAKITSSPKLRFLDPPANYEGRVYGERVVVIEK